MRALLDVIRENEVQVQKMAEGVACLFDNSGRHKAAGVLKQASLYLKVLDPEVGEQTPCPEVRAQGLGFRGKGVGFRV